MLVGILSMQRIVNYGSFMQAYSLKKMVESLGHKVVFVDYKTNVLIEDRNDKTKKQELLYQEIKDGIKFHILKKYGEQQKKFIECYPILGISKFKAYHGRCKLLQPDVPQGGRQQSKRISETVVTLRHSEKSLCSS